MYIVRSFQQLEGNLSLVSDLSEINLPDELIIMMVNFRQVVQLRILHVHV